VAPATAVAALPAVRFLEPSAQRDLTNDAVLGPDFPDPAGPFEDDAGLPLPGDFRVVWRSRRSRSAMLRLYGRPDLPVLTHRCSARRRRVHASDRRLGAEH